MMHNPIFWKWPAVSIFPNQDMFTNITMMVASGMVRFKQKHITVRMFNPTTLPAIIKFWMNFYLNCIARFAKTRFIITRGINTLATINTKILYSAFSIAFPGAIYATFTTMCEFSPILGTGNYMFCHIPILLNYNDKIKPTWWFGDRTVQHIKEKKGGTNKRNGTGPPIGARGHRDGRGGGNPGQPGPGSGAKSGGQKGTCK